MSITAKSTHVSMPTGNDVTELIDVAAAADLLGTPRPIGVAHDVTLVAHDSPHPEPRYPRRVGEAARVGGGTSATGESHVDVDEHVEGAMGPG